MKSKGRMLLDIHNLVLSIGERSLLKNINLILYDRNVYGLIGCNGCGKTTFLKLIEGTEPQIYEGTIHRATQRISHVWQHVYEQLPRDKTVLDYLLDEYRESKIRISNIEENLSNTESGLDNHSVLDEYQKALDEFEAIGGELLPSEVDKLLAKAGYKDKENQQILTMSGGEMRVLQIIKAMAALPDIILLDEPETHLDGDNVLALAKLISSYEHCVLIVSHNRYVLDNCCDYILLLEQAQLNIYKGNYSQYRYITLCDKVSSQRHAHEDGVEIEQQTEVLERIAKIAAHNSDPAWGKKLRSRRNMVERLKKKSTVSPHINNRDFKFSFQANSTYNDILVSLEDYQCKIGNMVLLDNVSFTINANEHVVLWGKNGCGKTTLLKSIMGAAESSQCKGIFVSQNLCIGYLSQNDSDLFCSEDTIINLLLKQGFKNVTQITNHLKSFLFASDDLEKKVINLSGGEKMLLRLAAITLNPIDLLILDEPTNHLDIFAQEALQKAIKDFNGALLLVTHDPYWVEQVAHKIIHIDNGTVMTQDTETFVEVTCHHSLRFVGKNGFAELQQEREELETKVHQALLELDYNTSRELCIKLGEVVQRTYTILKNN